MPNGEIPSRRVSAGDSDGLRLDSLTADHIDGVTMKTILALSAVLLIAGCEKRAATPAADTSAMAPAMSDTGMGGMTHSDSTMARDTAKK
jgi:uncharacterized lipoprotein YajG